MCFIKQSEAATKQNHINNSMHRRINPSNTIWHLSPLSQKRKKWFTEGMPFWGPGQTVEGIVVGKFRLGDSCYCNGER